MQTRDVGMAAGGTMTMLEEVSGSRHCKREGPGACLCHGVVWYALRIQPGLRSSAAHQERGH
jgi:hypothetical protein